MKLWLSCTVHCRPVQRRPPTPLPSHITLALRFFLSCSEQKTIKTGSPNEQLSKWTPGLSHRLNCIVFLPWFIGRVCAPSHVISLSHAGTSRIAFYTQIMTTAAKPCKRIHELAWNVLITPLIHSFPPPTCKSCSVLTGKRYPQTNSEISSTSPHSFNGWFFFLSKCASCSVLHFKQWVRKMHPHTTS